METESYQLKIAGFEGPFNLLLDLIEKKKMFINDISLAQVTEEYLSYVGKLAQINIREISSFILVASTLILIKSKSLLPNLSLTEEEEQDIKSLEERLRLYELFKKLSGEIKNIFGKKMFFLPEERKLNQIIFLPDEQINQGQILLSIQSILNQIPVKNNLPETSVKKIISLEEMISNLTERIQTSLKMNFRDINHNGNTKERKVFMIVGFLAMLEMIKQGIVDVIQENNFEDIIITKNHNITN